MEELPIYNVSIDPELQKGDNELGMDEIAFTSDPAILIKGVAFKNQAKKLFADEKKYRITAPAMIPMDIYRSDEDGDYEVRFTEQVIEELHSKFMGNLKNSDIFNVEHNSEDRAPAYILEAWIVDKPLEDKAYSTFGIEVPKGTLMLTAQITDKKFYEEIVEAGAFGFSIEAFLALQEPQEQFKQHKMELPNGIFTAEDGTKYKFNEEGVLVKFEVEEESEAVVSEEVTEVAPVAEVTMEDEEEKESEVEAMDEPKDEEEEMNSESKDEEEEVEVKAEVDPSADAEAVLAIVQPILDEIIQEIANIKNEMGESAEEAPAEDAEVEMSASQKFSNVHKFLKNG